MILNNIQHILESTKHLSKLLGYKKIFNLIFNYFFRLNKKNVSKDEYRDIFIQNLTDPSFKGTVLTCDIFHELQNFYGKMSISRRYIPVPIQKAYFGVGFSELNFLDERLNEIVEGLVSGGIINHFIEKMTKSKWNLKDETKYPRKSKLDLNDLSFGFQSCLFLLCISFLVLILELIMGKYFEKFRTKSTNPRSIYVADKDLINLYTTLTSIVIRGKFRPFKIKRKNRHFAKMRNQATNSFNDLFGQKIEHEYINEDDNVDHVVAEFLHYIIEDFE